MWSRSHRTTHRAASRRTRNQKGARARCANTDRVTASGQPVERLSARSVFRIVGIVIVSALALFVIYLVRTPLSWIFMAGFIAIAVSGPVAYLSRYMRRGFAIAIVYLGVLLIPVAMLALLVPPIVEQVDNLVQDAPGYADDVTKFVN